MKMGSSGSWAVPKFGKALVKVVLSNSFSEQSKADYYDYLIAKMLYI